MGNCNSTNENLDDFERNKRNANYHLKEYKKLLAETHQVDEDNIRKLPIIKQKLLTEIDALQIVLDRENNKGMLTQEVKDSRSNLIIRLKKEHDDLEHDFQTIMKDNIQNHVEINDNHNNDHHNEHQHEHPSDHHNEHQNEN